jgi:hypothetical protein
VARRKRAELGVLFVHGIGQQDRGETLARFGTPLADWVDGNLRDGSDGTRRLEVVACDGCPLTVAHRHYQLTGTSTAARRNWIIAECYWDDLVTSIDSAQFARWLSRTTPTVLLWQVASSMLAGFRRRTRPHLTLNPLSWYVFWCNSFWNVTLRSLGAYFFLLFAGGDSLIASSSNVLSRDNQSERFVNRWFHSGMLTLADAYSFVADTSLSAAIRRRFWRSFTSMRSQCRCVVVVGHSQGAAIAHATFRERKAAPGAFVGLGSGVGPLRPAAIKLDGRLGLPRLAIGTFLGITACAMAGIAIADVLYVATLLLMMASAAVLAGLVVVTSLLSGHFTSSMADLWNETPSGLRSGHFWLVALGRLEDNTIGALIFSVLATFAVALVSLVLVGQLSFLRRRTAELEIAGLESNRWFEFYSPLDPVCIGTPANRFATAFRVHNPVGWRLWREHGAYCHPKSSVLAELGRLVAELGGAHVTVRDGDSRRPRWYRLRVAAISMVPVIAWLLLFFRSA